MGRTPFVDGRIEERASRTAFHRLAARFAREMEDIRHDRLAALHLGQHLLDFERELRVARDAGHAAPVGEDDRERAERGAEFMRGARREEAHAHDPFLLRGVLAQIGDMGIARAQVSADADDEQDEQHRDHRKADPADDREEIDTSRQSRRQHQRHIAKAQQRIGQHGRHDEDRDPRRGQQDRPEHDLKQVQGDEGIGRAAAEIELERQHPHVQQQGEEHLAFEDAVARQRHRREQVRDPEQQRDAEHLDERQRHLKPVLDEQDGDRLASDGDPAKLDQLARVFGSYGLGGEARGLSCEGKERPFHQRALRNSRNAAKPLSPARPNQVSA